MGTELNDALFAAIACLAMASHHQHNLTYHGDDSGPNLILMFVWIVLTVLLGAKAVLS